jgi:hypothetical protein
LQEASDNEAMQLVEEVLANNRLAILWSRMFRAGAARPATLGGLLWPFSIQAAFLLSPDTIKDAIDLIAARYQREPATTREAFEREVLAIEFPRSTGPERAKLSFRLRIFLTIGSEHLATSEAQDVLRNAPPLARETANPRPFEIRTLPGDGSDPHWWLREEGVDLEAPANAALLAETEAVSTLLELNAQNAVQGDLLSAASRLRALWDLAVVTGAAPNVISHAETSWHADAPSLRTGRMRFGSVPICSMRFAVLSNRCLTTRRLN